jgi:DNA-binding MurR/RpiR family transcriptional regulator
MARPFENSPEEIASWRRDNRATIAQTAKHFGISDATVSRVCKLVNDNKTPIERWRDYIDDLAVELRADLARIKPKDPNDPDLVALLDLVARHDAKLDPRREAELDAELAELGAELKVDLAKLEAPSKHPFANT